MENPNAPLTDGYHLLAAELLKLQLKTFSPETSRLVSGFWIRWRLVHADALAAFEAKFSSPDFDYDGNTNLLLKKRDRMISALLQGFAQLNATPEARAGLAELVRQHDEIFRHKLQSTLNEIRGELLRARATQKAMNGYATTTLGRGIR